MELVQPAGSCIVPRSNVRWRDPRRSDDLKPETCSRGSSSSIVASMYRLRKLSLVINITTVWLKQMQLVAHTHTHTLCCFCQLGTFPRQLAQLSAQHYPHTYTHTHRQEAVSDLQVSKAHKCASVTAGLDQKLNCSLQPFSLSISFSFHS